MKKINKVLVLSAILAGIFGASIQKNKTVVKTEAVPLTEGTKLYLEPNGNWRSAGARFAICLMNEPKTVQVWENMTQVTSNPLFYEVTIPSSENEFAYVIFARMNGTTTVNNWDNKWNQSGDLVYDGTNDLQTVPPGDVWNYNEGTWSVYVPEVLPPLPTFTPTVEGIKSDKVRIWLDRSGRYDSGYQITMKIGDTYYLPTEYKAAINEGRWFVYYDMPLSAFSGGPNVDLVVFLTGIKQEAVIPAGTYVSGDNNKVWKLVESEGDWSVQKGAITERILNTFLAKVLEGYLTCSPSAENGYNAFPAIDTNFVPRVEDVWNVEGNLDMNIVDYAGEGTSGYGSDRGDGVAVNANAKYEALKSMYNSNLPDGSGSETNISNRLNSTSIAFIVITVAVSLFAGLFFFYKKKFVVR